MADRRHPAEVTVDRLHEALEKWPDAWPPDEREYIGHIIHRLERIAAGEVQR